MTTIHTPSPSSKSTLRKVTGAAAAGTVVEWFDFAIYGFLAPIIARTFFPVRRPHHRLLQTFAVFAVAFALRPPGRSLLRRALGDRIGRKKVLALTVLLMSGATATIGFLPVIFQHRHLGRRVADARPECSGALRRRRICRRGDLRDRTRARRSAVPVQQLDAGGNLRLVLGRRPVVLFPHGKSSGRSHGPVGDGASRSSWQPRWDWSPSTSGRAWTRARCSRRSLNAKAVTHPSAKPCTCNGGRC